MRIAPIALAGVLSACSGGQQNTDEQTAAGDDEGDKPAAAATETGEAPGGEDDAARGDLVHAGRLSVMVEWLDAPAELRRSAGRSACRSWRRPPVSVHTLGGLRGVIVWIEGAAGDQPDKKPDQKPDRGPVATIASRDCQLEPRVAIVPLGGELHLRNDDERRQRITVTPLAGNAGGAEPISVWLPVIGSEAKIPLAAARDTDSSAPALWQVASTVDKAARAYVAVPPHRFVAVTGEKGTVRFDGLAPGKYQVVAWHPPVKANGAALEARESIAVGASLASKATLSLTYP